MSRTARQIHLAARPVGEPGVTDFAVADVPLRPAGPGELLVRNTWMSVDPAVRGRMRDVDSYIAPFRIGEPLDGPAVGLVVESGDPAVPVGATVKHRMGWRDLAVVNSSAAEVLDVTRARASDYLGILGAPGLTAYAGLTEVAPVREGDTVLVTGAGGAVGLAAGAIARILGAGRVIGSAGGAAKAARLAAEFGYDTVVDYRAGDLDEQFAAAAPDGVDVTFDTVGGDHLRAAIGASRLHGRIALVGQTSQYNVDGPSPGPDNLWLAIIRRLTLRGFIVFDHLDLMPAYLDRATAWIAAGELHGHETVVEGVENAPQAFVSMLSGANIGKMLVKIGDAR